MSRQFQLIANCPPISLLPAAPDAAGRTSPFRNLKGTENTFVLCRINQGNAAQVSLTLSQAKDVSGTGAKAISGATPIWLNNSTAATDAYVQQAAALSFTTDATLADKIVVFEVTPEACMDIANGFCTLAITTGASNAANVTEVTVLIDSDYNQAINPSSYVN